MASTNSTNPNTERLYGATHGCSDNMPFLPEGASCCQYRTCIFQSKNAEEVIPGHTRDCNIPQSLLNYGHAKFFAAYPNGPFEDSYPVMETISNPPILRGTPKWADDGGPIYWYVDLKEKGIKGLLHPLAVQKYEKAKKGKGAEKSNDKKKGNTGKSEKKYVDKATQTYDRQATVENEKKRDGEQQKSRHAKVFNADREDVTGSGNRPRRMTRGEDELRPQLQPLRICPYHGEDNCEVDDPEWFDRQPRRSELGHLAMDSATTLVARPPQSYDPRSPREARHHMRSHIRPLNASNYRPRRVELHQENRNPNASADEQTRGLRGGALPTLADDISDYGETIVFSERDCRCVKYMVRGYGQPLEPVPMRFQVICERHDPNLQSRQARETWAEKDIKFMGLRGGAHQAKAAEESHKKKVSMEHDRMNFGDYAPVPTAVYEYKPEDKPEQASASNAPTSPAKPADNNGNGQSTSTGLRGGGMAGADEWSEAFEDMGNESESTSLSELFDRAKEIKTGFENSGPKTGRPAPAEERNRVRVTSFIEALDNPYGAAGPSNSSGCERCVSLSHRRLERWDDHELRKTIKEMQRDSNSISIRAGQVHVRKRELEDREEMLEAKGKTLNHKSRDLADDKAECMKIFNTFNRPSSSRGDLEAKVTNSKPQPVDTSMKAPTDARARVKSVSRPRGGASSAYQPITSNGARGSRISPTETRDPLSVKPEQVGMNEDEFESARAYQLAFDYQQQGMEGQREVLSSDYWTQYFFDNSAQTKQELYDCQDDKRKLIKRLDDLQDEIEMLRGHCYLLEQSNQLFTNYGMGMPGPANFPAPPCYGYPAYPVYPQLNTMSHQQSQRLAPAPVMTAFPMYGGCGTRFKPQPSEQLLADGGPDPEEFMTQRQQRHTRDSNEQAAAEKEDKENDQGQSQTWDAQALKDAEQEDAAEQKKQEKDAEAERKNQKQAWDRSTSWHY